MTRPNDDRPHDEPERDAWLSAALRHAPDASAAPPAALSETILRQARNAVKTPQPAAPAHPLMRLWSWLARPQIAGSFATVMVAVLVGMIWWDKPLQDTLPRAEAPAASPATSPSTAPAAAPTSAAPDATTSAAPTGSTTEAAAAAPKADASRDTVPEARRVAAPTASTDKPAPPPAARAELQKKAAPPAERDAVRDAVRGGAPAQPAPTPFPDAAPAAEKRRESNAAAQQRSEAPAADAMRDRAGDAATPAPARAAPAPAPAPAIAAAPPPPTPFSEPASPEASLPRAVSKAAAASGSLRSSLREDSERSITPTIDQPERWTWQRGAAVQPMTPALQAWLAQLDRAARWQASTSAPPTAAADDVLRLWRDGALRATIQIGSDSVWLIRPGLPPQSAPLSADAAAALRATLADAAP